MSIETEVTKIETEFSAVIQSSQQITKDKGVTIYVPWLLVDNYRVPE